MAVRCVMRMISWNVNGIRSVVRREKLQWVWSSDADIVCLQETKAHLEQVDEDVISPPGWKSFWSSGERKGYSGVATYVREDLDCDVFARGIGQEHLDNEGRVMATDHGEFILFNVYFPNGARSEERLQFKMDFYDAFSERMKSLLDEGRNVIVCGDVNTAHRPIDLAQPEKNENVSGFMAKERAWVDSFLELGFIDTFRAENGERAGQYTWWDNRTRARDRNEGWRIDYFFIDEGLEESLVDAWISPHILGSDHCPTGLELELF